LSLHPVFGDKTLIIGIGSNHPAGGLGMQQGAQPSTSGTGSDSNGNGKNGNGGNDNNIDFLTRGKAPSVVGVRFYFYFLIVFLNLSSQQILVRIVALNLLAILFFRY
jgi:hypothetical protein